MISAVYRAGLFVSSLLPFYILLIIGNYDYFWVRGFSGVSQSPFWSAIFGLIIISILSLLLLTNRSQNERHVFTDVRKAEYVPWLYFLPCAIPALMLNIANPESLAMSVGVFMWLGFSYVRNNLVYVNPSFVFMGYDIFRTAQGQVLISNYAIYDLKNLEGDRLRCRPLGYKVYLVRKK